MPAPPRLIAIGDIHGCVHALDALLGAIRPRPEDTLVLLGDLIDQGRESREVLDRIIDLSRQTHVVLLRGNHEEMLLAAFDNEDLLHYWQRCGGVATLNSYRFGGKLSDIPAEHLELIRSCRPYYETDEFIFVHANFDPSLPMDEQLDHTQTWAILEPENVVCHQSGKTVIVGHTEQTNGEVLDLGCVKCIDTACWRYGWLTALEVHSGKIWQASRFGILREGSEPPVGAVESRYA